MEPGSGDIEIDNSVDPPRFTAFGNFEGPEVTIPTSCPDVDLATRAQSVWIIVQTDDDIRLPSGGTVVSGTLEDNLNTREWSFTRIEAGAAGGRP